MTEEIKLEARLGEGARRTDAYLNNLATFQKQAIRTAFPGRLRVPRRFEPRKQVQRFFFAARLTPLPNPSSWKRPTKATGEALWMGCVRVLRLL